jgi:hypothetical protein
VEAFGETIAPVVVALLMGEKLPNQDQRSLSLQSQPFDLMIS